MLMLRVFLKSLEMFAWSAFVPTKYRGKNSRIMLVGKLTVSFRMSPMPFSVKIFLANSIDSFFMNGLKLQIVTVLNREK